MLEPMLLCSHEQCVVTLTCLKNVALSVIERRCGEESEGGEGATGERTGGTTEERRGGEEREEEGEKEKPFITIC